MSQKYLVAIGSSCIDEYYEMAETPYMGEKVTCKFTGNKVGGMIGNATAVYSKYGIKTYMIDFMNESTQAKTLKEDMEACGIDTSYIVTKSDLPDPKCIIMLKDGDRIVFIVSGHKKNLDLPKKHRALLNNAEYIYSTVEELSALNNYQEIIDDARENGAKIALDIEDNTIKDIEKDWEIIKKASVVFINDSGIRQLKKLHNENFIDELLENDTIVVQTLADKGCAVLKRGISPIEVDGHKVKPVDTTGAGDTFNASFLHSLTIGESLFEAARFANAAAARAIMFYGPRSGVVDKAEVLNFIEKKEY